MFERWRQENFFKYMREEFLLDALVDYRIEPEDPTRTIPIPTACAGQADPRLPAPSWPKSSASTEPPPPITPSNTAPTMRGFKIAYGKLGKQLRAARERLSKLIDQRRNVPLDAWRSGT